MEGDRAEFRRADERLDWYLDAKFGLFIHWGPYSVAGVEASWAIMAPDLAQVAFGIQPTISEAEYLALPQRFNPTEFDADAWARLARQAGVRYMVMTAKHHDGFCMFDAPGTDYKVTATQFGRDVCAELAEACARAGLRLGFYYSQPDMHHAGYRDTRRPARENWLGEPQRQEWAGYLDYMEAHLRKLLSDYGEVGILWFDGLSSYEKYEPARMQRLIKELSPNTLVNDRLGGGYDFVTPEQSVPGPGVPIRQRRRLSSADGQVRFMLSLLRLPGLKGVLQKLARRYSKGALDLARIPTSPYPTREEFQPWETCMTMNNSWAYNGAEDDAGKPAPRLIRTLVEAASRGGNYLLNVGPTPEGRIPAQAEARLREMGAWLEVNGEAIYGTRYGPLQMMEMARSTAREGTLYLHVMNWPARGKIRMTWFPGQWFGGPVATVRLLADGRELAFSQGEGGLTIEVPRQAPDEAVSVLAIRA